VRALLTSECLRALGSKFERVAQPGRQSVAARPDRLPSQLDVAAVPAIKLAGIAQHRVHAAGLNRQQHFGHTLRNSDVYGMGARSRCRRLQHAK